MENLKTTNIISTPEITGNIGSCTVQSNEVKVRGGMLTSDYRTIQINSCTSEVVSNQVYTDYFGVWSLIVFGGILGLFLLVGFSSR